MKIAHTIAFLFFVSALFAQQSPFKAGATIGINFSQADGDNQFGYDKKGLTLGLRGGFAVQQRWSFMAELLYNFKGAEPSKFEINSLKRHVSLDLHYAEIPVLAKFAFAESENGFYKWEVYGGVSYGRLLQSKASVFKKNGNVDTLEQDLVVKTGFKTSDISAIVGLSRYFTPKLGISLRHTLSLTPVYNNPNATTNPSSTELASFSIFKSFFISATIFYDFVAPQIKMKRKKKDDD